MCSTSTWSSRSRCAPRLLEESDGIRVELIGHCPYFETQRLIMQPGALFSGDCNGDTFEIWAVLNGSATVALGRRSCDRRRRRLGAAAGALGEFHVEAKAESTLLRVVTP